MQINAFEKNTIFVSFLHLAISMCEHKPEKSGKLISDWLIKYFYKAPAEAYHLIFCLCAVLGINMDFLTEGELLSIITIIIQKSMIDSKAGTIKRSSLSRLLNQIASLLSPDFNDKFLSLSSPINLHKRDIFLEQFEGLIPEFIYNEDVNVRIACARILSNWGKCLQNKFPKELKDQLNILREDSRGRVRFAAHGNAG